MPAKAIRLLILDVDGVLTDGRLYYGPKGETLKVFHVRDGHGIKEVARAGVQVAVISGRKSAAVRTRCRDLGIRHVHQGVKEKLPVLQALCKRLGVTLDEVACIGDDTPDVPLMQAVALSFAVADAHDDARRAASAITRFPGGQGAVREVCDRLVASAKRRKARG